MDSTRSDPAVPAGPAPKTAKILIAGGFGAGKTTMVGAITEIRPLRTEAQLSQRGASVDRLGPDSRKSTTTVAMDFGRITFRSDLALYLFGMPGQERFWFMWDELCYGAIGAVVLADTRRLADCFGPTDYFERRGVPFLVAVNCFDGAPRHDPEDVKVALDLDPGVPVVECDARSRDSVRAVLTALVRHVIAVTSSPAPQGPVADGTVPDGTVPDGTVPDGTVLDGTVPDGTVPARLPARF